ncbi:MAG: hypothetical protein M3468_09805, partial [Acidobacteriota bacterium]|nr:hypothetical protein [Acidobacteriota bacterium]
PASGSGSIAWTPDGQSLLFTTAERLNIWKHPAMGGTRERLTNFSDLGIAGFALQPTAPCCSREGQHCATLC